MYRAENGPVWQKEPKPKAKAVPRVKPPQLKPADSSKTEKDLFQPVSSRGVEDILRDSDFDPDSVPSAKWSGITGPKSIPKNWVHPKHLEPAPFVPSDVEPAEEIFSRIAEMNRQHDEKEYPWHKKIYMLEDYGARLPRLKRKRNKTSDPMAASHSPESGVRRKDDVISGKEISRERGERVSDLTASLHPSVWDDLEAEEHLEHARQFIQAVNEQMDVANSDRPLPEDDGSKKSSKRAAA